MNITLFDANIKSNPRMTAAHEKADIEKVFDKAKKQNADFITFCEIAYPRMRKAVKKAAKKHGYGYAGAHAGSENVVCWRKSMWKKNRSLVKFLTSGIAKLTPTRTGTWVTFKPVNGVKVGVMGTHLVNRWQNKSDARYATRHKLANTEIAKLSKKLNKAAANGHYAIVSGDVNAPETMVQWATGTHEQVNFWPHEGGDMQKMMQAAIIPPHGHTVLRGKHDAIPLSELNTDHPVPYGSVVV